MIVDGKKMLEDAVDNEYAIPAFGFVNLEGAKAIIKAAEELNAPVILQMTEGGIKYGGLEELYFIAKAVGEKAKVPIVIHLDHGQDIELIKKCIDLGFGSVMFDGSQEKIEVNCKNAKIIREYIANKKISLEVEVGVIGGKEDDIVADGTLYANIEEVVQINEIANPDMIAVSVGTSHGHYKGEVKINYDLIKESYAKTKKPIVLHGLSGVPSYMVIKAVECGVRKANFDTELKQAYIDGVIEYMKENPKEYDLRKIMQPAINNQVKIVKERIIECGAQNKGWFK